MEYNVDKVVKELEKRKQRKEDKGGGVNDN